MRLFCPTRPQPDVDPFLRAKGYGELAVGTHGNRLIGQHVEDVELLVLEPKLLQIELDRHGLSILAQV